MNLQPILFLVGPTSVGKTEIAVRLAKKLKGEIVSCDSMQVYKEINVASDKPSPAKLEAIPHHLINILSIKEEFDVAMFNQRARTAIADIHQRQKIPVVVGGSGLYISVLLDGIFSGTPKDPKLRAQLEQQAKKKGLEFLYERLMEADPLSADKIHPHDQRRIIRALEVFSLEEQPISRLQKERDGLWGRYDIAIFALNRSREKLYATINQRVDQMIKQGLVDEIKSLRRRKWSATADQLIGVKEIKGYLRGEFDLNHAVDLIKRNTRHFAKRQLTWFRKDKRLQWIMVDPKDSPAKVVQTIMEMLPCV